MQRRSNDMVHIAVDTVAIEHRVVASHRVRLLEAAIAPHRGDQALVAEQQAHGFIFTGVRREEQLGGEMAEKVVVQLEPDLLPDRALHLHGKLSRRFCPALSGREQEGRWPDSQQRAEPRGIEIEQPADCGGHLELEGGIVFDLVGRDDEVNGGVVARAVRDMSSGLESKA